MDKNGTDFEWRQFARLGDMIGEGLHHEEPWIAKEYRKLQKILIPETKEEKEYKRKARNLKNKSLDKQIAERLKIDRCVCGGELKQVRSGSKVVKCTKCNRRCKYLSKKV